MTSPLIMRVADEFLDFLTAMELVAKGSTIARDEWENDAKCCLVQEQLCIWGEVKDGVWRNDGKWHPWTVTLGDMTGEDWIVVE